jgi:penicillin-binding protein 2
MVWGLFVVMIAILIAKVFYLQIFESEQQRLTSENNHVELQRQAAPRGIVYDRKGVPLVTNLVVDGKNVRIYPLKEAIAPVMGYMSEIVQSEIGCINGLCYSPGMQIGRAGVEQVFEERLRGRDGGRLVEVNAAGKEVRELGSNPSEAGTDLHLSLDSRLQNIMYQALGGKKGSAVALDLQGKVLGLVSSPAYDSANLPKYLSDKTELYFLNRAISGQYPPGSVFKLVTSYAGLNDGGITANTQIQDTGEIKIGAYRFGNWYFDEYGRTEGSIGLVRAITRSNDIFFYKVGEAVGVDNLIKWARKFGLGSKTGIELPGEATGLAPDRLWKERMTGGKWYLGDTYHLAIGQGDLLVTPIQIARMTAGAVSGRVCQTSILEDSLVNCLDLGLKTDDINLVRKGMQGACLPGGTGFTFFQFQPYVLCKTGTAQQGGASDSDKAHAWITVAYPGDNPKLVLTVMLEAAGEGSYEAGPVALNILTQWRDLGN